MQQTYPKICTLQSILKNPNINITWEIQYFNKYPSLQYRYIGVFGERKLLYKFGTVQAIKYNPCIKWQVPYLGVLKKVQ